MNPYLVSHEDLNQICPDWHAISVFTKFLETSKYVYLEPRGNVFGDEAPLHECYSSKMSNITEFMPYLYTSNVGNCLLVTGAQF